MAPEREEGGQGEGLQADGEDEDEEGTSESPGRQKRPLPSTQSRCPLGLVPYRKKKTPRGLPSLCDCHGCGRRFPDKGRRERLRLLDSQWRIVLLCRACLRDVRSGQVCSYCFLGFVLRGGGSASCRECSCRVHVGCLPEQRGFLAPSDLDPDLFTCVDCCAFPFSRFRELSRFRDSSSVSGVSDLCLENVVKNATTAEVKNVVAAAAAAANVGVKSAADLSKGALDLVLAEKLPACAAVPDEELALRLHRAMNGSHRVSRNLCSLHSEYRSVDERRGLSNANLLDKEPESGNFRVCCGEVEPCTEDALLETMEIVDAEPLNVIGACEGNFIANLDMGQEKHQNKEVIPRTERDATELPAREEQASCSDKFVNSTGDKSSADGVSGSCRGPDGPDIVPSQQNEKHNMPDRYMKKYSKRAPRTKDREENRGSASLPVPVGQ